MIQIKKFTFNPFQENTYLLFDASNECVIIDPGCYDEGERKEIVQFIEENKLKPKAIWLTHAHIDHVLGANYIAKKFDIPIVAHKNTESQLDTIPSYSGMYGFNDYEMPPNPSEIIDEGDVVKFGNSELEVIYTPGHALDHVVFYHKNQNFVINGDVLFEGSYGRVDLPGGDFAQLKDSIVKKMFELPSETIVFSGHGNETSIGHEKQHNPILFSQF